MRRRSQLAAGIDRLATSGAMPRRSVVAGPAACGGGQPRPPRGPGSAAAGWRPASTRPGSPACDCCSSTRPARPTWVMPQRWRERSTPPLAPSRGTRRRLGSSPPAPAILEGSVRRADPTCCSTAAGSTGAGRRREPLAAAGARPRSPSASPPAHATVRSATLNGEIARQREIETRRRAEQRAPIVAALRSCRTRHRWGLLRRARRPPRTVFLAPSSDRGPDAHGDRRRRTTG